MTNFVRVKQLDTGHELSLSVTQYEWAPEAYEVLEKDAVDAGGNPLAPKHKTTVDQSAAAKKATSGQKTATTEGEVR